jgi:hypothetical protein
MLLCCAPLLLLNQPSLAIPASTEHWYFKAFIDNREVGYHSFDVTRDGQSIFLSSRADFEYRLLRVPLFSYTHEVKERYDENLCLEYIESSTETRREKIAPDFLYVLITRTLTPSERLTFFSTSIGSGFTFSNSSIDL